MIKVSARVIKKVVNEIVNDIDAVSYRDENDANAELDWVRMKVLQIKYYIEDKEPKKKERN